MKKAEKNPETQKISGNKSNSLSKKKSGKKPESSSDNLSTGEYDKLVKEADKNRLKKPGSQGNPSDRHNNGRGGGK